jgi:TRAP-type C4-dicarboxylate transport system permease small subunit
MDRVISASASVVLAGLVLSVGWLFSGGWDWVAWQQRPLAEVIAALGGPLGWWGGIVLLVGVVLATYGLHQMVNFYTGVAVIRFFRRRGHTEESLAEKVRKAPLSRPMKRRLLAAVAELTSQSAGGR